MVRGSFQSTSIMSKVDLSMSGPQWSRNLFDFDHIKELIFNPRSRFIKINDDNMKWRYDILHAYGFDMDKINPHHYKAHPSGIECIDVIEHMSLNVGNAVKYAWRVGLKPGEDSITDLEKAVWYLNREIKRLKAMEAAALAATPSRFVVAATPSGSSSASRPSKPRRRSGKAGSAP